MFVFLSIFLVFVGVGQTVHLHDAEGVVAQQKIIIENQGRTIRYEDRTATSLASENLRLVVENKHLVNIVKTYESDPSFQKKVRSLRVPCPIVTPCKLKQ